MSKLPPGITKEEMAAWRPFVMAATIVIGALDADMKANFGISHFDHALLVLLLEQPQGRARMSDLARMLHVEPSHLTYRVGRLTQRKLVKRIASRDDRRVVYAVITAEGIKLLRDAWPMHRDGIRRHYLSHVRPRDAAAVARVLGSIAAVD